jgi:hypothetical protein
MDYKAPAAKADRLKRKAARKEARADRQEARGKAGKAAKTRAKAAVKTAKAGAKEAKSAAKAGRQAARKDKKLARVEKRQAAKGKVKAGAKKVGKAAVSAAKKAASKTPAVKAAKKVAGAAKKTAGKVKAGVKKAKKVGTAVAGAAKQAMAMEHKGAAKYDRVVLGGNKGDKSKTKPGKKDYAPAMKHGKGPHAEGIGDDLKRAAKSVKAGFEYGAKSLKDDAKASYKKYIKPGVDAVVDAKNRTFGKNFFGDNVVEGIKGDAKSVKKALSMESASEERKADLKDNPVVDRSKEAMNKGDAPMMSRLHKSGGLYKAPSMGKIQYGGYERPEVKMGTGGKGLPMMGSSISKHMAHNKGKK